MNKWIKAFRLRTLPLALSSILMGGFAAFGDGYSNWLVLIFAVITTLLLQILSNLANDYGDFVKGTDNDQRLGPERALQSGAIDKKSMKRMIYLFVIMSFFSGVVLIIQSFGWEMLGKSFLFLVVGIIAIWAAIRYTVGLKAYGYSGLGDLFVFIFFGLVAVIGTYFLIAIRVELSILLPAITLGLFSTAILNLNNLRDVKNDEASNKMTLVVKYGFEKGRHYHAFLIVGGWIAILSYIQLKFSDLSPYLILLSLPFFIRNLVVVYRVKDEQKLDPELKNLALSISLFTLLFGLGLALI